MNGLTIHHVPGKKIVEVDTQRCVYRGRKVREMNGFQRKKLDNLLFLDSPRCESYCDQCLKNEFVTIAYR